MKRQTKRLLANTKTIIQQDQLKKMFNHLERPSYKVINKKLEDDKDNESNIRSCAPNENIFHSSKDIEKQKTNSPIYFTPKYDKDDIVRKHTNNNKGGITENVMSRNTLAIHTMKQDVQLQKVNQEPNLNNAIMKSMVDMWDNNKVDQNIKKDSSNNMLSNNTMENKCVQLKRNNEPNKNRSNKCSKDSKPRNTLDLANNIETSANYINIMYNISEKHIIRTTNRESNSVATISIKDNNIQAASNIKTDTNQTSNSSNEGILKPKTLAEIEQMESKSNSKIATVIIAKDILVSNTIEHESELTNSKYKIKESNTYKNRNIFEKEKNNKQRSKNISKNDINQCQNHNIDSYDNSNGYKKGKCITDEATASKANYIDLSFDNISKIESFVTSRKIEASIKYKYVIQRRGEERKEHSENKIVTVGAYILMNKEQCNNKVSNDIKPRTYKEIESVTNETNVGNNRNDEAGLEFTFKAKSYIKPRKDEENNQDNTIFQRKKEEPRKNAD